MSPPAQYDLVVPVKTLSRAKSRLQGFTDVVRRDLMRAFAMDALTASLASPMVSAVHVVTDEPDLAASVLRLGCSVLPDSGAGDLNRALRSAVASLAGRPGTGPVAAMLGDLPCLVTDDLTEALAAIVGAGFVADAAAAGTTLLAVWERTRFDPRFGETSRANHLAAGFAEVPLGVRTLRLDVDTAEDLVEAVNVGVGAHTRAVLDRS
ncbi:MAG: 2-phospho-L-lactate guanylyltransferase [Actinomycetota bacterium]|nr:2-phospho-L-lactate guanylyltransferase [Actinomycetota bacterium]